MDKKCIDQVFIKWTTKIWAWGLCPCWWLPESGMAEVDWHSVIEGKGAVEHFTQSGLRLACKLLSSSVCLSGLAWPEWATGLSEATYQEWLASVCGRPRERERESGLGIGTSVQASDHQAKPSGAHCTSIIPQNSHDLNFFVFSILLPVSSGAYSLANQLRQNQKTVLWEERGKLYWREFSDQSLPWDANHCKVHSCWNLL